MSFSAENLTSIFWHVVKTVNLNWLETIFSVGLLSKYIYLNVCTGTKVCMCLQGSLIIEKILSSCIGGKCAKTVKTKCFNKMIENVFSISEIYIPMGNQMRWLSFWVFLSAVWQPQGQLWAIFEKTASLTQCLSLRLIYNWPKGHQEYFNDKSIFRAKHQDFILDTWFFYIFFRTNCV